MPLSGNVLFDLGLGPLLLRDTYLLGLPHFPAAPQVFWAMVTAAAALGAATLIACLWGGASNSALTARSQARGQRDVRLLFVLVVGLVYAAGVAVSTVSPQYSFFDRYVIFLLLPAIAVVARQRRLPIVHGVHGHGGGSRPGRPLRPVLGDPDTRLPRGIAPVGTRYARRPHASRCPAREDRRGFSFNPWYGYDPERPRQRLEAYGGRTEMNSRHVGTVHLLCAGSEISLPAMAPVSAR